MLLNCITLTLADSNGISKMVAWISVQYTGILSTVELPTVDPPRKGHLCIKDTARGTKN